jgi:hypothetical protein
MKRSRIVSVVVFALGMAGTGLGQAGPDRQHNHSQGGEVRWSFDAGSDDALRQSLAKSGDVLKGY